MLGTFGGALEARQIDASDVKLTGEVTGEVEEEDRVLASHPQNSRFDAPESAGRDEREGGTCACRLRHELPCTEHCTTRFDSHLLLS